jgi:hypothetical protein
MVRELIRDSARRNSDEIFFPDISISPPFPCYKK